MSEVREIESGDTDRAEVFYQAVLKLRRRGSRVYADGRMHLVDGARLSSAELVERAAALRPEPEQLDFGW